MQAPRWLATGCKEPADTPQPSVAPGFPLRPAVQHAQSHRSVSQRSLHFPGMLRENGGTGTSHAGLCQLTLLLAPCSSPWRRPRCPMPGVPLSQSRMDGIPLCPLPGQQHSGRCRWDSAAAFHPVLNPDARGGDCVQAHGLAKASLVWGTSKRLHGQAGSFWGPGNRLMLSPSLKSCRYLSSQILIQWCDNTGRRMLEPEVSCRTQNRLSINCTVTVSTIL